MARVVNPATAAFVVAGQYLFQSLNYLLEIPAREDLVTSLLPEGTEIGLVHLFYFYLF